MTNSPWKDFDEAFEPMFDESVSVKTKDGKKTTLRVSVFTDGTADPLMDDALDTEREDITFVFARRDWPFVQKLVRGDTIERAEFNGLTYKVSEALLDNCLGWCVKARSLKEG